MTDRREVRVADSFFVELDRQLPAERGPNGEPSATDFLILEMPRAVEKFATQFETLPEIVSGVPTARSVIATGALAWAFAIYGVELTDGAIEIIGIEIEL